ncbi:MAG: histidinol phosphate phosphatase domain-containing protein [Methanoregula sp.]|jgi:histidinol phosphatase-like PHP family hydrolase|nr:histidinol phosphate phosphatase domain-containing protein [Methanoregula sp.]MDD5025422.1 histidinol phosphate phosphatase domain-containing protein [Methanoregula sp.]MDD5187226.1 histidinol phosphate phosphatase domain-containing protein [Methanoregula sp.]
MYDLHTHSILSDGEMLPTELVRRMAVLGYTTVAITDHVDASNTTSVVATLLDVKESAHIFGVQLLCGVEITHVPPTLIAGLARQAKTAGADIVVVHGESPVEPVAPGTNTAACACRDVDVLAHPGLITHDDARLAAKTGVALELTSRGGHNRTNGHVALVARETSCQLVIDSDAHAPHDLLDERAKILVGRGAGLTDMEVTRILSLNIDQFLGF